MKFGVLPAHRWTPNSASSIRDRVLKLSKIRNPTPRHCVEFGSRARPDKVGGPHEVAEGLEEWFTTGVCDGFATAVLATYIEYVLPEPQRRGLYHKVCTGPSLRENLGLPIRHGNLS